jgi:hypothetical protein
LIDVNYTQIMFNLKGINLFKIQRLGWNANSYLKHLRLEQKAGLYIDFNGSALQLPIGSRAAPL